MLDRLTGTHLRIASTLKVVNVGGIPGAFFLNRRERNYIYISYERGGGQEATADEVKELDALRSLLLGVKQAAEAAPANQELHE